MAKKRRGRKKKQTRKIPINKVGGFVTALPLLGSAIAAGSSVYKTYKDVSNARKAMEEQVRHHKKMEELAKRGRGLFLRPYKKKGGGLKK